MKFNNKKKNKPTGLIITISVLIILLVGAGAFVLADQFFTNEKATVETNDKTETVEKAEQEQKNDNNATEKAEDNNEKQDIVEETFIDIQISAVGDVMAHTNQLVAARNNPEGAYNFESVFDDVKPYIENADLALANLETTLAGESIEYSGYPLFNAPDALADALLYAGFDTIVTANNHSLDTRAEGLRRTAEVIEEKGMDAVGTYKSASESDQRFLIKDVKGIKVAIMGYTEHLNGLDSQYSAEEIDSMVNTIDEEQMTTDIEAIKAQNPDIIVAYMHWGEEYTRDPNTVQKKNAEFLASQGVDIIFGSHPHVIHEAEYIKSEANETFVSYSMGNFVSNQRTETLGEGMAPTEDGVIVNVDVEKNEQTGETRVKNVSFVPTWVYRHSDTNSAPYTYKILPIEKALEDENVSEKYKERMKKSYQETVDRINMPSSNSKE
ncbi:MAG: CapA family protein [Alkalibacterium sp.]|uniref:CapA family protein n=1 Tax=Alkalibacterium TaxID=99906 RepID=UPI0026479AD9|nr:CapA family protein [Alkalibacterium sp.]MDN6194393.1 CapA family protein [Alkalibacterium sp.]MDN6294392.1 CapA family protein [Alkalibacterium sp.]MDN6296191.1 CapA family protein [Alkalibacterium sp.]MDN6326401.1 CapA family protein [Alkalibacterium sp.]MDN6385588.1 CapA family protein [Alkalibacterium sp.]